MVKRLTSRFLVVRPRNAEFVWSFVHVGTTPRELEDAAIDATQFYVDEHLDYLDLGVNGVMQEPDALHVVSIPDHVQDLDAPGGGSGSCQPGGPYADFASWAHVGILRS